MLSLGLGGDRSIVCSVTSAMVRPLRLSIVRSLSVLCYSQTLFHTLIPETLIYRPYTSIPIATLNSLPIESLAHAGINISSRFYYILAVRAQINFSLV